MSTDQQPSALSQRVRAVPRLMRRAPWWLTVVVGLLLVGLGLFLLTRPLTALGVLGWYVGVSCVISGVGDLLSAPAPEGPADRRGSAAALVAGSAWILVGVAVLVWVGRSADVLGPLVAGMLLVSGVLALLRLFRDRSAESWLGAVFGLAEIAFGVLALVWPDATLIVIAILFGGRTVLFGVSLIGRGLLARLRGVGPASTPGRRSRWLLGLRWTGAVLVLALAAVTLLVSARFRDGIPVADAFYDAPADLPNSPGKLLKFEPYDGDLPAGLAGYRLLYVTTDADGTAIPASGVLAVPTGASEPAPLISWAHGTVGVTRGCAPSIGRNAISETGMPAMDSLARNGWAMVATDYPGMGTDGNFPYLIGQGEGRSVLDAARAARQVPGVRIADRTVIWGHSQGGHAALWAGQLAASYAPELNVVGTAALSPASDPMAMAATVLAHPDSFGASLAVSFVIGAYTRYYSDLDFDQVIAPSARTIVREAAARCTGEGGTLVTILAGLAIARDQPIVRAGALAGPFGTRLTANIPTGPWSAPLFVGQGEADEVIPFRITQRYVSDECADGAEIELHGYPAGTHMSILETGSPLSLQLEKWTSARLAGEPATGTCG
ncbi:lipase family protein [Nakamurella lactea]|uniref:lipase family protein n=1 Tax=Nakamurella lactea TaxID=459515 RepID=UPI001B7F86EE|nr:lipase family protein [Nakamurella lactea]